jgi:hypothetical protein
MRVVVLPRQGRASSEADLPMATHAAVNASQWRLVAYAVVPVEGRVIVLTQVIFLLVNSHSQSPRWWLRRMLFRSPADDPVSAQRILPAGQDTNLRRENGGF